jgi:predicted nucleic acid-binding Zn ribbon protein
MPEHIDEAWEYWTPDVEIAEVLAEAAAPAAALDLVTDKRVELGLRFGKGDPDRALLREAREKPRCVAGRPRELVDVTCPCGVTFRPDRAGRKYHSRACCASAQKFVPFASGCPVCGSTVPPGGNRNGLTKRYCSGRCQRAAAAARRRVRKKAR